MRPTQQAPQLPSQYVFYNIEYDDFELYGELGRDLFLPYVDVLGLIYLGEL